MSADDAANLRLTIYEAIALMRADPPALGDDLEACLLNAAEDCAQVTDELLDVARQLRDYILNNHATGYARSSRVTNLLGEP